MALSKSQGVMALALITTLGACSASKKEQASAPAQQLTSWQTQPLTIDGYDDDWVKPLPFTDAGERINYAITNDADNLYIRLSTHDQLEQQKIIQGGMTVWLNTQAQKTYESAVGIGFPTDSRNSREKELMKSASRNQAPERAATLADLHDYGLYNFDRDNPIAYYDYTQSNNSGIVVKMNYNNAGDLVYEASVPLTSIYPKNNATGKTLAVGIFVEGIPGAKDPRGDGGGGGVSIGGGLGFGSFGSGGGLGLSIGSGSLARLGGKKNSMSKQKQIWKVVDVARATR